jgi:hypothetical protein
LTSIPPVKLAVAMDAASIYNQFELLRHYFRGIETISGSHEMACIGEG